MFKRLKRLLVQSYIGAIALGILLADAIVAFTNIFVAPLVVWTVDSGFGGISRGSRSSRGLPLEQSLAPLARFFVLILIWYFLLRWLYSEPLEGSAEAQPSKEPESLPSA